ncbi:hypothetical protein [Microbulbifer agarilyticus]|uniref:hypothetical protein n=1 Tax=Microbulbifer agarilyticus TaxID=260552 RepID=UPI0012FC02AE|nr:hypothetical protein [Microbulbifer agarilyticus]
MRIHSALSSVFLCAVVLSGCGGGGSGGGNDSESPDVSVPTPVSASSSYSADVVGIDVVRADSGESVSVSGLPLEGNEINVPDE